MKNDAAEGRSAPGPGITALLAVFALFLATGMSGLIYQVVWQRHLLNVFGATIYSVSTVLAAFMGGLALGSWLFGARSERIRNHLAVYGVLEIAIGLVALAVPTLLRLMDPFFEAAYRSFGSNFFAYSALRFVFVFAILLIPTTLMGGTVPLLSKFLSPTGRGAGMRVGLLYAINTTGAVLGTFLSGFYLIRWWGIWNTTILAAILNIGAGVIALSLAARFRSQAARDARPAEPLAESDDRIGGAIAPASRRVRWVLAAYAVSGFAALGLEVTWSRSLVFTFDALKNTTYSFTAMLTAFLVGIALGSAAMTPLVDRHREPFRLFGALQALIGITSIFSFFVLYYFGYDLGSEWIRQFDASSGQIRWNAAVALVFLRTAAVVLLPTFCMGLAFPAAVRAVTLESRRTGREVGRLYALNTLGAILGSAATGFLLLPLLGIAWTILVLGGLQLLVGVALLARDEQASPVQRWVWTACGLAFLIAAALRIPSPAIFQRLQEFEKVVFYKEGPFATVSVLENSLGFRTIYVDNVGVAGTDPMLLTDQKSLAHVPMLMLKNPKSALTVGFGSGGASYSYTLYPELERIDCVEITRTVPTAAPWLQASNRGIIGHPDIERQVGTGTRDLGEFGDKPQTPLWKGTGWFKRDPRYNIILDDARSYLRFTDRKYDVIATDCTDLRYKSNANLYDLEYFQLCRDSITDDGMVVVWMPLGGLSDAAMKVALRTFHMVFPEMEVFFMNNQPTHYVLLIGTKEPLKVDPDLMKKRLENGAVARDLAEIQLDSAEKILSCFITGRAMMPKYLGEGPLNTEDFPYLEFESPRYGYGDDPLLDNLDELMKFRENPARLVESPEKHGEFLAALQKYYEAAPDIIQGHRDYREIRLKESAQRYMAALEKNPDDASVKELLNFDEVRRKAKGQPGLAGLWAQVMLGELMALQKRDAEAVTELNAAISYAWPATPEERQAAAGLKKQALLTVAEIYQRTGRTDRAEQARRQAEALP